MEQNILKKTSKEWNEIHKKVILDTDGWDRKNYEFSFNEELIDEKEFLKRVSYSTTYLTGFNLD